MLTLRVFGSRCRGWPLSSTGAERLDQQFVQQITQGGQVPVVRGNRSAGVLGGGSDPGDRGDVLGAGAPAVFLAAAAQYRSYDDAFAKVQCADASRAAELVPSDRQQIHAKVVDGVWQFAGGLGGRPPRGRRAVDQERAAAGPRPDLLDMQVTLGDPLLVSVVGRTERCLRVLGRSSAVPVAVCCR